MVVRKTKTDKEKAFSTFVSLDDLNEGDKVNFPEDDIVDGVYISEMRKLIFSKLSDFEKKVFELYLDGYKYKEIAKKLSKSENAIDSALHRIKEKCKQ